MSPTGWGRHAAEEARGDRGQQDNLGGDRQGSTDGRLQRLTQRHGLVWR